MKKILVTGSGKLAESILSEFEFFPEISSIQLLDRDKMDITDEMKVINVLQEFKDKGYKYLIHTAAICKPMNLVEKHSLISLETNIIGTANVAKACHNLGIKFVYISTDYVYSDSPNPYENWHNNEEGPIQPRNKYAWSKLGGECVAQLIPNSLILRCAITEIPFRHKDAYNNYFKNSISHTDISKLILKLIDEKGIINIGSEYQSIYDFVKKYNPNIQKGWDDKVNNIHLRINLSKLNELQKKD